MVPVGLRLDAIGSPEAFVARAAFEPVPGEVRQWAYNAAVDAVIVGRVHDAANGGGWRVEAALRSGHSGAEFARHLLDVELGDSAEAALDRLAVVLLSDLGYRESPEAEGQPWRDPRSPEPPVLPGSTAGEGSSEESGGGLGGALGIGGLREQEAIEINAEEAEIVDRGEARRLVFQRNVRVRQGDVSLNSDVVEAEYRKGESEPDRLIARGSVEVGQGQRRARCDEAVYQRNENRISCVGHAELVQGCDVVRGDAIEFDLSGERARVVGAASIVIREGEPGGVVCTGIGGEAP